MQALILVDIQNDFTPTGALPVPDGDQVVPIANKLQDKFDFIVATQDWHPDEHKSFAIHHQKEPGEIIMLNGIEQILWPVHCVQESFGAEFVAALKQDKFRKIFQKGLDPEIDSYSGFFDNDHKSATGLGAYLQEEGIEDIFIAGLALDYCVKYSALDAASLGFKTHVVVDATRGVNINEDDSEKAISEMEKVGIKMIKSQDL